MSSAADARTDQVRTGPVLETVGLGKQYRGRWVLRNCSLQLPAGSVCALVGPNGAGKTTLMRIITGLTRPSAGAVTVLGTEPTYRGAPAGIGFLAQEKPLYRSFSVDEMLRAAAALNRGPGGTWDAEYARKLVAESGIPPASRIGALSGGQRTRIALALALGRRPALLVLDEPFADLDPAARRKVITTLLAEVAETGTTVLLSSHVLGDLENVCDQLMLLRDGALWLSGDVEEILAAHSLVTGPRDSPAGRNLDPRQLVQKRSVGRQMTAIVRGRYPAEPGLDVDTPTLEELVIAYLDMPARAQEVEA